MLTVVQLFISLSTLLAYWLLTHKVYRYAGLWTTMIVELMWISLWCYMEAWGLLPISFATGVITAKRIWEE